MIVQSDAHDTAPELSCAQQLAWRGCGAIKETEDLREFLAPVYGWFTEGFDTRDLSGAKALLEEFATP